MNFRESDARTLLRNRTTANGEAGAAWVRRLPDLVARAAERWSLTLEPHFANLSYNYVAPARRADGSEAVLKVCFVDDEFVSQAAALHAYDGHAAARLLEADLDSGALLLERLRPGESLSTLGDDSAEMHVAAEVMRRLWQAPSADGPFPDLNDWLTRANLPDSLPNHKRSLPWIERALSQAAELVRDSTERCLVHGDLHFDNILSSHRGWLAIDPKGILGEPAWELAPLLINHLDAAGDDWPRLVRRRLDQLTEELSLDRRRAYALAAVRSLQSRFWSLRDDSGPASGVIERAFHCAEELAKGP